MNKRRRCQPFSACFPYIGYWMKRELWHIDRSKRLFITASEILLWIFWNGQLRCRLVRDLILFEHKCVLFLWKPAFHFPMFIQVFCFSCASLLKQVCYIHTMSSSDDPLLVFGTRTFLIFQSPTSNSSWLLSLCLAEERGGHQSPSRYQRLYVLLHYSLRIY